MQFTGWWMQAVRLLGNVQAGNIVIVFVAGGQSQGVIHDSVIGGIGICCRIQILTQITDAVMGGSNFCMNFICTRCHSLCG